MKTARIINSRTQKANLPENIEAAIELLGALPYKNSNMASRHWGNARHSICSFPSKMKPSLAATLVTLFSNKDSVVLDPFCGSGTIPFEAALQTRVSIGSDLSPLAFVLTKAKIVPPKPVEVSSLLEGLQKNIAKYEGRAKLEEMEPEIRHFFHEKTSREIITARNYLREQTTNFTTNNAGIFVSACLAHILHGNRPYALSRRSHNIIPIPPKGEFSYKSVITSLTDKCQRMIESPLPETFAAGKVIKAPASDIPLKDHSIDVVITSPPFFGTTEFLRQNRLRNWFVGWDYKTQEEKKEIFLEHRKGVEGYPPILQELFRLLKPEGILLFHVGIIKNRNMASMLAPLLSESGFENLGEVWEDTSKLETHGRTDRGGTHQHGFIIYQKL